ncbi:response regulator [bacterium]|nr:response regulator [bacterium]
MKIDSEFAKANPLNILVAEDNALNQKLIQKILNKLGYEPKMAGDGEEALNAVKTEKFDVLFMDLQMPHMDGITATQLIKEQVKESHQPLIIALTANVSDIVKEKCFSVGMTDFMSKPIKIDEIAQLLQKYA